MSRIKGFITMATGSERYYEVAVNLYRSYKIHGGELPFTIICDRHNKYTKKFDNVIILSEVQKSYLDKFSLFLNLPYDENFFIEPDCLIYKNIDSIFDHFENAPDFYALNVTRAELGHDEWFVPSEPITRKYPNLTHFLGFHPGYMFFRKGELMQKMYDDCVEIGEYLKTCSAYKETKIFFNGVLRDDPVIWLAAEKNNCFSASVKSSPYIGEPIYLPGTKILSISQNEEKLDIIDGYDGSGHDNNFLLHFSTRRTREGLYSHQVIAMKMLKFKCLKPFVCFFEKEKVRNFYLKVHKTLRGMFLKNSKND